MFNTRNLDKPDSNDEKDIQFAPFGRQISELRWNLIQLPFDWGPFVPAEHTGTHIWLDPNGSSSPELRVYTWAFHLHVGPTHGEAAGPDAGDARPNGDHMRWARTSVTGTNRKFAAWSHGFSKRRSSLFHQFIRFRLDSLWRRIYCRFAVGGLRALKHSWLGDVGVHPVPRTKTSKQRCDQIYQQTYIKSKTTHDTILINPYICRYCFITIQSQAF